MVAVTHCKSYGECLQLLVRPAGVFHALTGQRLPWCMACTCYTYGWLFGLSAAPLVLVLSPLVSPADDQVGKLRI